MRITGKGQITSPQQARRELGAAHAAVLGPRLLTRDDARYRTYFPTVELIAP